MLHKEFKTYDEQLDILKSRGLVIKNDDWAKDLLSTHNYYRLSGYMLTLKKDDTFYNDVSLEDVVQIYDFDRSLRLLLMDYLEEVELALRSRVAYELGAEDTDPKETVAYLDVTNYTDIMRFLGFASALKKAIIDCQNEAFVKHHNTKYDGVLPSWAMVETLSFGVLSRLYDSLDLSFQKKISADYSMNCKQLYNWVSSMVVLRNMCAHHLRLFNRGIPKQPGFNKRLRKYFLSEGYTLEQIGNKLFFRLIVIARLLDRPNATEEIIAAIKSLSAKYPFVDLRHYGFKENWEDILREAVALCFNENK